MAITGGELGNLWRQHGSHGASARVSAHLNDLVYTVQQRGSVGHRLIRGAEHADVNAVAGKTARAGHAFCGARIQRAAVMLGDNQYSCHQISPFSCNAFTSAATSLTMMPFSRWAGGSVWITLNWGVKSTSSSAAGRTSRGFFLAFMMSGSFT